MPGPADILVPTKARYYEYSGGRWVEIDRRSYHEPTRPLFLLAEWNRHRAFNTLIQGIASDRVFRTTTKLG